MSLQRLCLHVPNLRELTLDGSCLLSLRDLGCGLKNLRKLRVARCGLDSLDGLYGLMGLRELHAADNTIDDVGPCSVLHYIKRIDISRNRVSDISYISFLRVCPALKHLTMSGCPATETACYRLEVRRLLSQLTTLDGEPLHRGAAYHQDDDSADDDDNDDADEGGIDDASPISSADDGDSDDDFPHFGAGDAGSRPGSGRRSAKSTLPAIQGILSRMPKLPPLRPLQPLPPIKSHSRPTSAAVGGRTVSPVVKPVRPTTGIPKIDRHHEGVLANFPVAELRQAVVSRRLPTERPLADNIARKRPAGVQGDGPTRPAISKLPSKKCSNQDSCTQKPQDREEIESARRVEFLLLDQEERIDLWTQDILKDPTLGSLERLSVLVAGDEAHGSEVKDSCSNLGDDIEDPGPSSRGAKKFPSANAKHTHRRDRK